MPRPSRRTGGSRLALDTIQIPLSMVSIRLDRRPRFDAFQYEKSAEMGRRLTQWEAMDLLLESLDERGT
jgi:hypothetical protein